MFDKDDGVDRFKSLEFDGGACKNGLFEVGLKYKLDEGGLDGCGLTGEFFITI